MIPSPESRDFQIGVFTLHYRFALPNHLNIWSSCMLIMGSLICSSPESVLMQQAWALQLSLSLSHHSILFILRATESVWNLYLTGCFLWSLGTFVMTWVLWRAEINQTNKFTRGCGREREWEVCASGAADHRVCQKVILYVRSTCRIERKENRLARQLPDFWYSSKEGQYGSGEDQIWIILLFPLW